jgi:hypothetical protein
MKEYIVETYNNPNITNISIDNLSRTYVFIIILDKIKKIQKILENVNLLSKDSIQNLTMFINMDIANKEREVIEKILKKQEFNKELDRLKNKEKKCLNLFTQIILFLEKNIKKLQDNDDEYIESISYETTISKQNSERILKISDLKLNQIKKILEKLKILIEILTDDNKNNKSLTNYTIKRLDKLENDVFKLQNQEKKIIDYDKYYEYHTITITENNNGELSLSL